MGVMDPVDIPEVQPKKNKKRSQEQLITGNENKKSRLFFPKLFRKQLNQENSHTAVKQFLDAVKESKNHDYILEYLDCGGSCLELLQTLELDSSIPPLIVFELLSQILLRINASCPQYQSAAYEACRYMLNNYATVISKMINLSSTTPERKACLKLLTAMVTLSSTLAKDILIHINFHSTNIELLTKQTGEKNSVRDHFVRFLTAYLIDVHYPTLSVLLEKKGFITSIVKGLQFDSADTVCLVISAMKNHILENPLVSKTAKMRTFNTVVVRDIVNLYNWKGPGAMAKKNNKTVDVDQHEKRKVNECVHDFLLVLCTSHKFGVIFKDPLMGLGKKNQNALMYTVLESLDRPWDHSFASELVQKICGACPDLAKTVWNNLKQFLIPRMSEKWLSAMTFAKKLIQELQPSCNYSCMKDLNVTQVFQILQCLVSPLPVIKTILPENKTFESPAIKLNVISLLSDILKSLNTCLQLSKSHLSANDHSKLKSFLDNFISKHFLDAPSLLKDYENDEENSEYSQIQFLELAFDIFEHYKVLAPNLLDGLCSASSDLSQIFANVETIADAKAIDATELKVKMINAFIAFDKSKFLPHTPLFSLVLPLLFKKYYRDPDVATSLVLKKLLENSGIFEECHYEISVWIDAVLNLKKFDESVVDDVIEIMKVTIDSSQEFFDELYSLNTDSGTVRDYSNLLQAIISTDRLENFETVTIRHKYLSPMVLGLLKYSAVEEVSKSFKTYASFALINLLHLQTRAGPLVQVIQKCDFLADSFKDYAVAWEDGREAVALAKFKGKLNVFEKFSQEFLFGSIDSLVESEALNLTPDLLLNLLDASNFYFGNLLNRDSLSIEIVANFTAFVVLLINNKSLDEVFIERILNNPVVLSNITFLSAGHDTSAHMATYFIVDTIKALLESGYKIEIYLTTYRRKLLNDVMKVLKKPHKYETLSSNIKSLLQLFSPSYDDCCSILSKIASSFEKYQSSHIALDILVEAANNFVSRCRTTSHYVPLNATVVQNLTKYFATLANNQKNDLGELSKVFLSYLQTFPHDTKNVEDNLFQALLQIKEFNNENIKLAVFLMDKNVDHVTYFVDNVDSVCEQKGVLLPLLAVVVRKEAQLEVLQRIYDKFEKYLSKALQKPQKAGQHFHRNYEGLVELVGKCMPVEKCRKFCEKVQKFEVTEAFHANLLGAICVKALTDTIDAKRINNIVLTFAHLLINVFKRGLKTDGEVAKADGVASVFNGVLTKLKTVAAGEDLKTTNNNETVKLFCKYCLKFGISTSPIFLKSLSGLLDILYSSMAVDDGRIVLEMLLSHSEFLGTILGKYSEAKLEILSLFLDLCKNWPEFMERNHIPVLLASYGAMVNKCDKILLTLFKMYESRADQTKFYDFQPFLWGKAAASHYSVKLQLENALWRQPKMGDVLEILQDDYVRATITGYPLNDRLHDGETDPREVAEVKSYDLTFLLPLFSQLLAPEQQVQTYKFTRSGALSLTVVALSSSDKEVRQAACHILSRFHNHVEARQSGKDNILWIRYVEAVCKGTALLPDYKLNNFAAIYLARMALTLTQPNHLMYLPLSQHLVAKASLDFGTVPELYTFLHSSDLNYKEHRLFALQLLRDGLRTDKDFADFCRSMAFKLSSELYSSSAADPETRTAVLEALGAACRQPLWTRQLCDCHSLLAQLFGYVRGGSSVDQLPELLKAAALAVRDERAARTLADILKSILYDEASECQASAFYEVFFLVHSRFPGLVNERVIEDLSRGAGDPFGAYMVEYGCEFLDLGDVSDENDRFRFLRLLIFNAKRIGK